MEEKALHRQKRKKLIRRFNHLVFILLFFVACSPKQEASQVKYLPQNKIDSLLHYYDDDQIDSIVSHYQSFVNEKYSLKNQPDSVQFRVWAAFGYALKKEGNYNEALKVYVNSLEIAGKIYGVKHWKYGAIANNIAVIYRNLEEYPKAIIYYNKDLGVNQDSLGKGQTYNNLGALYRNIQKYDSAIYCYQQASKLLPEDAQYYPQNNLGILYSYLEDWDKSREYFENAIRLGKNYFYENDQKRHLIASTYNRLAYIYLINDDYTKSLDLLAEALAINHEDVPTRLRSHIYQIECLDALGNYAQALKKTQLADKLLIQRQSSLLNEKDKLFFVSQTKAFARWGFQLARKLNDLDKAFYFAERSKGAVLQELNAKSQKREFKASNMITISNIQQKLSPKDALIEYQFNTDSLYAFVITQGQAQLLNVATAQAKEVAKEFWRSLVGGLVSEFIEASPRAFEVLFAPIEPAIQGKEKLVIIPDQSLSYIPWEAMIRKKPESKEFWKAAYFKDVAFLMRDYIISYHNSASLVFSPKPTKVYEPKIVGFAPSTFPKIEIGEFLPLEGSQFFAREIPRNWPGSIFYTGQATKSKFVNFMNSESNAKYLHIDTHGIAHPSNPDSSALAFKDSLFYLKEILNLNKNTFDLIILAACSSGEGYYIEGEGVISLARGFVGMGARNIIHSLWFASDKSTSNLFIHFYDLVRQGQGYAEALQEAKLELIKGSQGLPLFWANFVLFENFNS